MIDDDKKTYWHGAENKFIRFYFYVLRGLDILNTFRNCILAIFGIYYTLKLDNPVYLLLMFIVSLIVLCLCGYISVHRIGKVVDWLNVRFSTHYGAYQINLQEKILEELKKLNENRI